MEILRIRRSRGVRDLIIYIMTLNIKSFHVLSNKPCTVTLTQVEATGLPHHWDVRVFGRRRVKHFFFRAFRRELGAPQTLEIRRVRLECARNVTNVTNTF